MIWPQAYLTQIAESQEETDDKKRADAEGIEPPYGLYDPTIDAVKERADIVDVVGEHVVLRKRGSEFVGICPYLHLF